MPPSPPSSEAPESGLDVTSPGVPVDPPTGLSDRELADWYREQIALREEDLARLKAVIADRDAELAKVARDAQRLNFEQGRAEVAEAQIASLRRELNGLRERSGKSLHEAEQKLQQAAKSIAEAGDQAPR